MSTYTTKHMKTETYLVPMSIRIENNKILCNKFGNDFLDLLGDLGWEYQRMGRSGREVYDEICHLLNMIPEDEVYMEI